MYTHKRGCYKMKASYKTSFTHKKKTMTYKQTLTVACKNTFLHSNTVENMLFANTQMVVSFTNVVTSCCREYVDIVLKHKVMPNAMPQRINKQKKTKKVL